MSIREVELDCGGYCTCCDADCGTCCCCLEVCPPTRGRSGYCQACGLYPEDPQPTPPPGSSGASTKDQPLAREASSRASERTGPVKAPEPERKVVVVGVVGRVLVGRVQLERQDRLAREALELLLLAGAKLVGATMGAPYREEDLVAVRGSLDGVVSELGGAIAWRTVLLQESSEEGL